MHPNQDYRPTHEWVNISESYDIMQDLAYKSASQLAKLIQERQISAVELIESHLQRISTQNDALNAIATLNTENARAKAQAADKKCSDLEIQKTR